MRNEGLEIASFKKFRMFLFVQSYQLQYFSSTLC